MSNTARANILARLKETSSQPSHAPYSSPDKGRLGGVSFSNSEKVGGKNPAKSPPHGVSPNRATDV